MANCKSDFRHAIEGKEVLCAWITRDDHDIYGREILRKGYSPEEFSEFLEKINYEYDAGYGTQVVFGIIWYEDGTWSERGEYDGAEWWEHMTCPQIPEELQEE